MAGAERRTVSLPPEQTAFIDRAIASGNYASTSDVVEAGLKALQEREADLEKWLQDDVAPVFDAILANPARVLAADDVFAQVRVRHRERLKAPA